MLLTDSLEDESGIDNDVNEEVRFLTIKVCPKYNKIYESSFIPLE